MKRAPKKIVKVDTSLRLAALQMATSQMFSRRWNGMPGYQGAPGQQAPEMTEADALARAKSFYAWMTAA